MVVVGSYVPDSSKQLQFCLPYVTGIELAVERVIRSAAEAEAVSREVGQQLEEVIQAGRVGVVYTSRTLVTSANHVENLAIAKERIACTDRGHSPREEPTAFHYRERWYYEP